jgi:Skp family chaperone for outer membrane proteins
MNNLGNLFKVLLFIFGIIIFSECGFKHSKENQTTAPLPDAELVAKFQQEQNELLAKSKSELSGINKKIVALNDKIHQKGGKLTSAQNDQLDDFEKKRASINQRIHQIKNVTLKEWETFKIKFENDLTEVNEDIDRIFAEL